MGHNIIFVGRETAKLDRIKSGKSPIFEPGLDQLLIKNKERISTTTDIADAVRKTEVTFICVGTPACSDGSSDLSQIETVSHDIGKALRSDTHFRTIVVKSTVLPGTTETLIIPELEKESRGRRAFVDFGVASNPEFLRRGYRSPGFL